MKRAGSYIYVSAEVPASECLSQLDDDELVEELESRGQGLVAVPVAQWRERIEALLVELAMRRHDHIKNELVAIAEDMLRMERSKARAAQRGELEKA